MRYLPALLLLFGCATPKSDNDRDRGQLVLSAYGGITNSPSSDVRLRKPGGTNLTIENVDWDGKDFEDPPFYGLRATWFFPRAQNWGVALDFTHAKIISDTNQVTRIRGTRDGAPTDDRRTIRPDIDAMELSHGHNFLTLNGVYRWFPKGERDRSFLGRLQPYVGVGAGLAIPHVDVMIDGGHTSEYQAAGFAAQGFAGINVDIAGPWSAFLEYKATWSDLTLDLENGATLDLEPWTHQFILGASFRW